jgi:hypothetical protein
MIIHFGNDLYYLSRHDNDNAYIYIYIYAPPNDLVVLKYYYSHLIYKRNMTK